MPVKPNIVVKVSGSLFDLPDLGPKLKLWLDELDADRILLVPGGGAMADVVRELDRIHHLGEVAAHCVALGAMAVGGLFLASLQITTALIRDVSVTRAGVRIYIVDALGFGSDDIRREDRLPCSWKVTSDSIAARVAQVSKAEQLILLKSISVPPGTRWDEAAEQGWVDPYFAQAVHSLPQVSVVNFREWCANRKKGAQRRSSINKSR